ncbi:MAG: hypothetical protein J1F31_05980 [Erysipelotrichales bacterium]|nr:hypothetical protein [Erysipelotrichales bacterium]
MNAHEKVFLLAEIFGVDVTRHINTVLKEIEDTEHYKQLVINVEMANKYQVPYTQQFLKEYEDLKINTITSIKDALVARAKVDYLYQISQPKYYINPIMFNPLEMSTDITTIGELPCFYQNKEITINDLILLDTVMPKEKIKILNKVVNKWHLDAKETVLDEINIKISKRNPINFEELVWYFERGLVYPVLAILGLLVFGITIFSSSEFFKEIVHGNKMTSYAFLIYAIFLFVYLIVDLIDFNINKKYLSEKDYCLYYLKSHAYLALKGLDDSTFQIKSALLDALKEKKKVNTNITRVNSLSNFRRMILFLNMKDSGKKQYSETLLNNMNIIKIVAIVLLLLSFFVYAAFIAFSLLQGGAVV